MLHDPALEADVRVAEDRFYQALRRLHQGDAAEVLESWADDERVTTMNAAGGYEQGRAAVAGRWTWWASQGRPMPATRIEHLALIATADLAYTVALEHHAERVLRVTHVWGRQAGGWKLLHRHADPLLQR